MGSPSGLEASDRSPRETARGRRKRQIREWEAALAVHSIRDHLTREGRRASGLRVLEVGCGAGLQIDSLRGLGWVVGSDLVVDREMLTKVGTTNYVVCDAARAPFRGGCFDVMYSNHVLEHVEDVGETLREARRIAGKEGVIAVSLPTPLWLLLTVPAQVMDRVVRILRRLLARGGGKSEGTPGASSGSANRKGSVLSRLGLRGHGRYPGFLECFLTFRAAQWRRVFRTHGFDVVRDEPLLAYATTRWPVIPTNRWMVNLGLVSSRLYLLKPRRPG